MRAFTFHLFDEATRKLAKVAGKLRRPPSSLATQAVEEFVSTQEWQIAEVKAGLLEADRGEFVSAEDVAEVLARYAEPAKSRNRA